MTTLTCPCGRRLKINGRPSGKTGRCPACGAALRVPSVGAPPQDDEWNWQGSYGVESQDPADRPADKSSVKDDEWDWEGAYDVAESPLPVVAPAPTTPVTKTEKKPPPEPEPWFPPPLLFPGRNPEGVVVTASIGFSLWVLATLVPEYCLALVADADGLGALPMGHLVGIVTAFPFALFAPLMAIYWLQYLGRVLVSAAEGERNPPRPPDRNMDGLLGELPAWLSWSVLGLSIGALPLALGCAGRPWDSERALALGLFGLPYVLMALLLTFLHDDSFAARPWAVVWNLVRVGPSFLILSLVTAALLGAGAASIAGLMAVRGNHFRWYIAGTLAGWSLLVWMTLVAMHTLGAYVYARRDELGWQRAQPWWAVG